MTCKGASTVYKSRAKVPPSRIIDSPITPHSSYVIRVILPTKQWISEGVAKSRFSVKFAHDGDDS